MCELQKKMKSLKPTQCLIAQLIISQSERILIYRELQKLEATHIMQEPKTTLTVNDISHTLKKNRSHILKALYELKKMNVIVLHKRKGRVEVIL